MAELLRKPAIKWASPPPPPPDCPYWNEELVALLSSLDDNRGESNHDKCCLSYGSLLVAAVIVSRYIRQCHLNGDLVPNDCDRPTSIGVSIVVAIPEGPLLPVAVLVVHLLNQPMMTVQPFAVLVPLEPNEGRERLRHQLQDLQPSLILCLPGKDSEKLKEVLDSISPGETRITNQNLHCAAQACMLDFGEIISDSIKSTTTTELDCIRPTIAEYMDELKTQHAFLETLSRIEQRVYFGDGSDNRISHIVFTSGTTGKPKGCVSSIQSLRHYLNVKNEAHEITSTSTVLLASALSFDPCLSDILATFQARATLVIAPRAMLIQNLSHVLQACRVTHVLCTPTLWGIVHSAGARPNDFPSLKVVALGGEVIPKHITRVWARDRTDLDESVLRLCSTYGVTEACVYQTFGEVWRDDVKARGQNVGKPLRGLAIRIRETSNDADQRESNDSHPLQGEVILQGKQLDEYSGYLNNEKLSREKFRKENDQDEPDCYSYSTGDRGYIDVVTNDVHIMGRIEGEDGMVKINGVRVELGEVENALIDSDLVTACLAVDREMDNGSKHIYAFCILSRQGRLEIGLDDDAFERESGVLLTTGPLLLLLRARCKESVRAGVIPSKFFVIERLPLSPTGKRDRRGLPQLSDCVSFESLKNDNGEGTTSLWEYGSSGATVADQVVDCLNLQQCQLSLLTTSISFGMLGGDSLAATRLVRSLYAQHHGVVDSRFLGDQYGVLDGHFAVSHLIRAKSMGDYVDWLDEHGVCCSSTGPNVNGERAIAAKGENESSANDVEEVAVTASNNEDSSERDDSLHLYEALLETATSGQTLIACVLLDHGVDPNLGQHGGRLGKTRVHENRKRIFRSNPLHLACSKGDSVLVKKLLDKGCNFTSPDAAGSFPPHLAASSTNVSSDNDSEASTQQVNGNCGFEQDDEDQRRYECVKALLEAGAPLTMKESNKQTVFHCAARAGHVKLLDYLLQRWPSANGNGKGDKSKRKKSCPPYEWTDKWSRTPVHWAVLNGHVNALKVLLDGGCNPNPSKPKSNRQTSVVIESPLEICGRLYSETDERGKQIRNLLVEASSKYRGWWL